VIGEAVSASPTMLSLSMGVGMDDGDGDGDGGPVIKPLEIGLWAALQGVWARQLGYSAGRVPIGSAASLVVSGAPVEGLMGWVTEEAELQRPRVLVERDA